MANGNSDNSDNSAISPGKAKVALDLDGAPFLEEKPKKTPPPKKTADPVPAPETSAPRSARDRLTAFLANRKRLYLIGGGLVALLVTPLLLMLVFSGSKTPEPEPIAEPQRITAEPQRADAPAAPAYLYKADGFFVPLKGSEGEPRFLNCDFAVPTDNPQLFAELTVKNIAVRDSIYYYLNHKSLSFLADQNTRQTLKQDLVSVINEHVSAEEIQELYIENYMISGK